MVASQEQKLQEGRAEEEEENDEEGDGDIGFEEMGLDPRLLRAVIKKGLSKPTPIQLKAIPLILEGKDIVARAKTGSGKTLAYLLPLVHKLLGDDPEATPRAGPRAFVLVPTRELCQQVYDEVRWLLELCGATLKAVQLTTNMSVQTLRAAVAGPPDVVVATPARISACISNELLLPSALQSSLSTLVLDEADLLLSYGYEDDIRKLAPHVPRRCQCLLMSATSSSDVDKLKKLVLHNPVTLTLMEDLTDNSIVPSSVQQFLINCKKQDKLMYVLGLLRFELIQKKGLIFVNTVDMGFRLKLFLEQFGIKSAVLNGELPQNSRLHILQEFNVGLFDYLIATDDGNSTMHKKDEEEKEDGDETGDASKSSKKLKKRITDTEFGVVRGVDFKNVRTVINYNIPLTAAGYVHRIGRTGRAGNSGISVSLVSPEEEGMMHQIEELLDGTSESKDRKNIAPFPLLTTAAVEALRYRAEDVARSVTKISVREARAKELRMEILNSDRGIFGGRFLEARSIATQLTASSDSVWFKTENFDRDTHSVPRLKAYFEDNPTDLELLKHDKVLSKKQPSFHLRTVPEYLRDPTTEAASRAMKISRAAMGQSKSNYAKRKSKRSGTDDPLKTFSAKPKKRRVGDGGARVGGKGIRKGASGPGGSKTTRKKHQRRKR